MEQINYNIVTDTIAAVSTPAGIGGIAIVRVSGPMAISIVNKAWKGCDLENVKSHTVHLGKYYNLQGDLLDEALVSIFKAPDSFTGENIIEINVHGSSWIQREILSDLIKRGARIAEPGEFTQRAFLNGKIDLAQAEGVADLIASSSKVAHDMAINQTRGTFSKEFDSLREKLIEFASLLELELDFSEEDVEFADRSSLFNLLDQILKKVGNLASSYSRGAVLKEGVPVVIAGIPNAGKSSLLNLLLSDDKAIVTDIPGTTRDLIEDTTEIEGILFRFIDTAGLRETSDVVEGIGVNRALSAMEKAFVVIWMIDTNQNIESQLKELKEFSKNHQNKKIIILLNKSDLNPLAFDNNKIVTAISSQQSKLNQDYIELQSYQNIIPFSTKTQLGLPQLIEVLVSLSKDGQNPESDIIVSNARHFEALTKAKEALIRSREGLESQLSSDLVAQDIREAINHLATITGSITTDTLLHSIFSRFCIGK